MTAHEAASNLRWYYCLTEPCEWLAIWIGPHRHLLKDDGRVGIVVERLTSEDVARTSDERIQAHAVIRVEVSSEADVTRMVAAFTVLPVLRDSDYEIFLLPVIWPHDSGGNLRAWRKDGERGGTSPSEWGEKR